MGCFEQKKVSVGDSQLAVVEQGQGVPLLLVHGFPLDHSMWEFQIRELAGHCRVIAPDLPGFGASSPLTREVQRMEDFADALAGLLDQLGVTEPIVFCGLSMGGYIAWQFWRRHTSRLRGLILCDTRAAADAPEVAEQRRVNAERVLREGPGFFAQMMLGRLFAPRNAQESSPIFTKIRDVMLATPPQSIAAALRGMAERPDARGWLPEIHLPCLIIVGEEDALSPPAEMQQIANAIPGAQMVTIPSAGHLAPLEHPQAVNAAIREFLRQWS
jgi:pimeloyl-ACP methyl ester carboxylesterase